MPGVKMGKPIKVKISKKGVPAQSGKPLKKGSKLDFIDDPKMGKKMGGTMKKPVMAKKGKMNKLNPGLKAYLAKKKKTKKKK